MRSAIMVLMQNVASTAADAAYPNTSTNDISCAYRLRLPARDQAAHRQTRRRDRYATSLISPLSAKILVARRCKIRTVGEWQQNEGNSTRVGFFEPLNCAGLN